MINLTIIVPTKNSEKYIKYFLDSLKQQDYQQFKLFVADSSSTDNTLNILKDYKFDLKIVSEIDNSAEEGINKCLEKIDTDFFCLLNSDDVLGEKFYLSELINTLKGGADVAIPNFGNIANNKFNIKTQKNNIDNLLYHNIAPDIGWMAKRSVLKEGNYTTKYKLATSYHFLLRLFKKNYIIKRNLKAHYFFRLGGNSFDGFLAFYELAKVSLEFGANKFIVSKIFLVNILKYFIKYKLLKFYFKL